MMTGRLKSMLHHLHRGLEGSGPSDGQLLERYLARRDESAFAALVQRHGPMVLGVCRRVLRNRHDAEDAFQATFLVLVRKATTVRPRELVGHWLYGVAYRTALKAKTLAARRSAKERRMVPQQGHHEEPPADWLPLLDEEVQRLPEKYRLPVVLCDLHGKTRKEAARQLGWPDGTLSTRLTRARVMLAERLTRRGVVLAGGAAALVILHGTARAKVPPALAASTVKAAMGFAAGHAATAVSAKVAALTQGVLNTMLLSKLKTVLAVGVVLALVGLGIGAGGHDSGTGQAEEPPVGSSVVPAPPTPTKASAESPTAARLPRGPMPTQALVQLTRTGTLAVTTRQDYYEPVTSYRTTRGGDGRETVEPVTSYRLVDQTRTEQYSRDDVQVYDMAGKRIPAKEVASLLKEEVMALVSSNGAKPDPLQLRLFKEGTLVLVLPAPTTPAEVPGVRPTTPIPPAPPVEPETTAEHVSKEQMKLLAELQGEWRVVSNTFSGNKLSGEMLKDLRVEFRGNVMRSGVGPSFDQSPSRVKVAVSSAGPNLFDMKAIDPADKHREGSGIYKLEGEELTLCVAFPGVERPKEFAAPDGSKRSLVVLRRVPKE